MRTSRIHIKEAPGGPIFAIGNRKHRRREPMQPMQGSSNSKHLLTSMNNTWMWYSQNEAEWVGEATKQLALGYCTSKGTELVDTLLTSMLLRSGMSQGFHPYLMSLPLPGSGVLSSVAEGGAYIGYTSRYVRFGQVFGEAARRWNNSFNESIDSFARNRSRLGYRDRMFFHE